MKYGAMALIGLSIVASQISKEEIPCASYNGEIATLSIGSPKRTWSYEGKGKVYVVRVFHILPEGVRYWEDMELGSSKATAEAALWQIRDEAVDWARDNAKLPVEQGDK